MPALEITSMSTKGQIVLPLRVRNDANLKSGTKFAVMTDGENILLKPIESTRPTNSIVAKEQAASNFWGKSNPKEEDDSKTVRGSPK